MKALLCFSCAMHVCSCAAAGPAIVALAGVVKGSLEAARVARKLPPALERQMQTDDAERVDVCTDPALKGQFECNP